MDLSKKPTEEKAKRHLEKARQEVKDAIDMWRVLGGSEQDLQELECLRGVMMKKMTRLETDMKKRSGLPIDQLEVSAAAAASSSTFMQDMKQVASDFLGSDLSSGMNNITLNKTWHLHFYDQDGGGRDVHQHHGSRVGDCAHCDRDTAHHHHNHHLRKKIEKLPVPHPPPSSPSPASSRHIYFLLLQVFPVLVASGLSLILIIMVTAASLISTGFHSK